MKLLSLDASSKAASCALAEDGRLLGEYYADCGLTHSQTLLPMVRQLLDTTGTKTEEITHVAVSKGPGSFTGLRIGLAAAKSLAAGLHVPLCGVSTLLSLAYNLRGMRGTACTVLDARRGQVYYALFALKDGVVRRLCEDRAGPIGELRQELKNVEPPLFLVGDGAMLCYNSLQETTEGLALSPEHLRLQRASSVGYAALALGEWDSAGALVPSYLRLSQAERELLEKEKKEADS